MKLMRKLFYVSLILICSSCAMMFNDEKSAVSITSTPPGADIIIEGRNYGKTPAFLSLDSKPYDVSLIKEGYGSTKFKLEVWHGLEDGADGKRCLADALGAMFVITFYSAYFSDSCLTFKESEHNINIPYTASNYGKRNNERGPVGNGGYGNNGQVREQYQNENSRQNHYLRQGYGRSQRLPVY